MVISNKAPTYKEGSEFPAKLPGESDVIEIMEFVGPHTLLLNTQYHYRR
jgi:hypothetical protein